MGNSGGGIDGPVRTVDLFKSRSGLPSDLTELELRRMRDEPPESACFGDPFLWTALFHRDRR